MAVFPSDSIRTKNWGTEILTDSDLESQLDLLHAYFQAALNATTGHTHDGTSNQGPLLTTLGTLTTILKEDKGADVASAAGNIVLGDDGNFFDITGTAAITSITIKPTGTMVTLQTDSTASLVDGGNLKLAGNFQGAADSTITLRSDGTNWYEVSRSPGSTPTAANALSGSVIQVINSQSGAVASGSTAIPFDDTDPDPSSEGNNLAALNTTITPNNSSNIIEITGIINLANGTDTSGLAWMLWKDSDTTSLNVGQTRQNGSTFTTTMPIYHRMVAGTTSPITFKINYGGNNGTVTVNGYGAARKYGGKMISHMTVKEIKA